jgi:uncharacterized membrane protein
MSSHFCTGLYNSNPIIGYSVDVFLNPILKNSFFKKMILNTKNRIAIWYKGGIAFCNTRLNRPINWFVETLMFIIAVFFYTYVNYCPVPHSFEEDVFALLLFHLYCVKLFYIVFKGLRWLKKKMWTH